MTSTSRPGWLGLPRAAWAIAAGAVPFHLALALATDLSPDEAYYLSAARLGRRIVDHPPALLWLLAASDHVTFAPVELRVRAWAVAFSFATTLVTVALARARGAGEEGCSAAAWVAGWALLPTAGGFVTTPDGPLLLGVAVALLVAGGPWMRSSAPIAGMALLVAALSKVVALPIGALLAAAGRRAAPLVRCALLVGPLLALPWIVPSLRFQLHHAYGATAPGGWSPLAAIGALAGAISAQALLWSPPLLWLGLRRLKAAPLPDQVVVAGLTALVLLSALIRGVPPEPNWWAPAALAVIAAAAASAGDWSGRTRRAILLSVLLPTALAAAHTIRPWLPLPEEADPTARLHGWRGDRPPSRAPGVGPYGPPAEDCVYRGECQEILSYFNKMNAHEESRR